MACRLRAVVLVLQLIGLAAYAADAPQLSAEEAAQQVTQAAETLKRPKTREEIVGAVDQLKNAARAGNTDALYHLARVYSEGRFIKSDYKRSMDLARAGADRGNARCMMVVAIHYAEGWGVDKDPAQAAQWMRKSAAAGDAGAARWLKENVDDAGGAANARKGAQAGPAAAGVGDGGGPQVQSPYGRRPVQHEPPPEVMPTLPDPVAVDQEPGVAELEMIFRPYTATGGRPGGEVLVTKAMLRVMAGGLNAEQTKALDAQYADEYVAPTATTASRHRRDQDTMLRALIEREILLNSIREQEASLREAQIAEALGDLGEKAIAEELAAIQNQMVQESVKRLEKLAAEVEEPEGNAEKAKPLPVQGSSSYQEICQATLAVQIANLDVSTYKGLLGKWVLDEVKKTRKWEDGKDSRLTMDETSAERWFVMEDRRLKPSPMHFRAKWDKPPTKINVYDTSVAEECKLPRVDDGFSVKVQVEDAGSAVSEEMWNAGSSGLNWSVLFRTDILVGDMQYYGLNRWRSTWVTAQLDKNPELHFPRSQANGAISGEVPITAKWQDGRTYPPEKQRFIAQFSPGGGDVTYYYKWAGEADAPKAIAELPEFPVDENLDEQKKLAIKEHLANIAYSQRCLEGLKNELNSEDNLKRQDELRFQILHQEQDIHDSKDLIESIRTGKIVHTRGPWETHAEATAVQASVRMAQEIRRAQQMQASALRMIKVLDQYSPEQARKARALLSTHLTRGVFAPGGMEKAQRALDRIHGVAKAHCLIEQAAREDDRDRDFVRLSTAERNLAVVESVKRNCDRAVMVGTIFTPMWPGMAVAIGYEGMTVGIEKGATEAVKQTAKTAAIMGAMCGVMKAGEVALAKFLNPNSGALVEEAFAAARFQEELAMNRALVGRVKETQAALAEARQLGKSAEELAKLEAVATEAVSAANSSTLAKRIMKNELYQAQEAARVAQKQVQIVAKNPEALAAAQAAEAKATQALREVEDLHCAFQGSLDGIYSKVDDAMVKELQAMGYNVEKEWFMEFRNATSRGVNCDRDLGLVAAREAQLMKGSKPVTLETFMEEAQKVYEKQYRTFNNGRSAKLADQNITTSVHSESFPLDFLDCRKVGTASADTYRRAGTAIRNKVVNALGGSDPAMVNLQKAYASLSKDLKTKVIRRLECARPGGIMDSGRINQAREHWEEIAHVMDDFAKGRIDPMDATRKVRELSGGKTMEQIAEDARRLMSAMGG